MDLSEAIVLFLQNQPSRNEEGFEARFGTGAAREAVQAILDETVRIPIDWAGTSLVDIGAEIRTVMRERHPELSEAALGKLANYVTYLLR